MGAVFAYCLEVPSLDDDRIAACAAFAGIDQGLLEACGEAESAQGDAATVAAANITAQYSYVAKLGASFCLFFFGGRMCAGDSSLLGTCPDLTAVFLFLFLTAALPSGS
jgi:hypothetical protein